MLDCFIRNYITPAPVHYFILLVPARHLTLLCCTSPHYLCDAQHTIFLLYARHLILLREHVTLPYYDCTSSHYTCVCISHYLPCYCTSLYHTVSAWPLCLHITLYSLCLQVALLCLLVTYLCLHLTLYRYVCTSPYHTCIFTHLKFALFVTFSIYFNYHSFYLKS